MGKRRKLTLPDPQGDEPDLSIYVSGPEWGRTTEGRKHILEDVMKLKWTKNEFPKESMWVGLAFRRLVGNPCVADPMGTARETSLLFSVGFGILTWTVFHAN